MVVRLQVWNSEICHAEKRFETRKTLAPPHCSRAIRTEDEGKIQQELASFHETSSLLNFVKFLALRIVS